MVLEGKQASESSEKLVTFCVTSCVPASEFLIWDVCGTWESARPTRCQVLPPSLVGDRPLRTTCPESLAPPCEQTAPVPFRVSFVFSSASVFCQASRESRSPDCGKLVCPFAQVNDLKQSTIFFFFLLHILIFSPCFAPQVKFLLTSFKESYMVNGGILVSTMAAWKRDKSHAELISLNRRNENSSSLPWGTVIKIK